MKPTTKQKDPYAYLKKNRRYLNNFNNSIVLADTSFLMQKGFAIFSETFLDNEYSGKIGISVLTERELARNGGNFALEWLRAHPDRIFRFGNKTSKVADQNILAYIMNKITENNILLLTDDQKLTDNAMSPIPSSIKTTYKVSVLRLINASPGLLGPNNGTKWRTMMGNKK